MEQLESEVTRYRQKAEDADYLKKRVQVLLLPSHPPTITPITLYYHITLSHTPTMCPPTITPSHYHTLPLSPPLLHHIFCTSSLVLTLSHPNTIPHPPAPLKHYQSSNHTLSVFLDSDNRSNWLHQSQSAAVCTKTTPSWLHHVVGIT